jgi:hypothetical protein
VGVWGGGAGGFSPPPPPIKLLRACEGSYFCIEKVFFLLLDSYLIY